METARDGCLLQLQVADKAWHESKGTAVTELFDTARAALAATP